MIQSQHSFKITMQGPFNVRWADYVGDKLVHVETNEGKCVTTTLFGYVADLSAFLGTLHTFIDMGYPVVAFEYRKSGSLKEMEEKRDEPES